MVSSSVTQQRPSHPFDVVAAEYDAVFTGRLLSRWLRAMVWQRLAGAFEPDQYVLELGCGTGEDATWLAGRGVFVMATDVSAAMLELTRAKADAAGVGERVTVAQLNLEELRAGVAALNERYDGVVSNFGPVNCVENRQELVSTLSGIVRPGGRVVVVVMGPLCPWEIVWHLGHRELRTAIRRLRSGAEARVGEGGTVRVWYPSILRLQSEFAPHFKVLESAGIGLLLPPSAMAGLVDRAPRFFGVLARLDRRFAGSLPWRLLNDHYVLVLERLS
ncbi:class I SAM-dependent methyltransferase [soil metagenome]